MRVTSAGFRQSIIAPVALSMGPLLGACSATDVSSASGSSSAAEEEEAVVATPQALTPFSVLSDASKRTKLLAMLEAYLPVAQSKWTTPSNIPESTGYFTAAGAGVGQFRGEAGLAYGYATLLYASPDSKTWFGPPGNQYSRSSLEERLRQTIRHLCYTNKFKKPASGTWGGPFTDAHDQGSIGAFEMGWASHLLGKILERRGSSLDADTAAATKLVVTTQADQLLPPTFTPKSKSGGNTRAEENAWHSAVLALAAAIYDPSPHDVDWDREAKNYAINASSRAADEQDNTPLDGKTVAQWVSTVNLSPDYTLTNHSFFHPVYSQGVSQNLFDNAIFYRFVGASPPGAFEFRVREIWENVMAPLSASDGDFVMPAGTDWVTHDYQHIPYLAGIAATLQRNDASVLESRAIERLALRQAAQGGSFFGHGEIGYETDVFRNVAQAYWVHDQLGTTPSPSQSAFETATAAWNGVKHFSDPDRRVIVNRNRNALVTMSWMDNSGTHPTGLIVPSSENALEDPILMQYWVHSGPGAASGAANYTCDCRPSENFFSTAGIIGSSSRFYSMTSWPDGTTLLLDRGTSATFVAAFETAAGLVGPRPTYAAGGLQTPGTIAGNWVNVANRYGMAARGQLGFFLEDFADSSDHDIITNPHRRLEVSGDSTVRNRGALVLPGATAEQTALASLDVDLSAVSDTSWSALSARAPDGSGRLAVARWGGGGSATVTLTSPLGAPIPDRPNDVTVSGNNGSTSFSLDAPASTGFKSYFWVSATASLTVRPISETLARITTGSSGATVTARYADGVSALSASQAVLGANQVTLAHALDQGVALVTPSASTFTSGREPWRAYDGSTSTSSYWSSTPQNLSTTPQELRFDFGRAIDIGKLTMTPLANLGPKNYVIESSPSGLAGSYVAVAGGTVSNASASAATTTTFTTPIQARYLRLRITSAWGAGPLFSVSVREISVEPPALDLDAIDPKVGSAGLPQLRLARGGFNQATLRVTNSGSSAKSVSLSASASASLSVSFAGSSSVSVPAGGKVDVLLNLVGTSSTPQSGSSLVTISANGLAAETIELLHTSNLALNDVGTAFPKALASSEDPAFVYPPRLANDGDTSSSGQFWVSGPAVLSSDPQCLLIDLGAAVTVGRAVMVPRTNYGPKDYKVQTATTMSNSSCLNESGWSTRDTRVGVTNGSTITSTFSPVTARYVRLRITATHAHNNPPPPHQSQVRELQLSL